MCKEDGKYCTALLAEDGWQFIADYPQKNLVQKFLISTYNKLKNEHSKQSVSLNKLFTKNKKRKNAYLKIGLHIFKYYFFIFLIVNFY